MAAVETQTGQFTTTRTYREIAQDPQTNKEDRRAAVIRHNLSVYIPAYFEGLRPGDEHRIVAVLTAKRLQKKRIICSVLMANGEVDDGEFVTDTERSRFVKLRRTPSQQLIEMAKKTAVFSNVFQATQIMEPPTFPPELYQRTASSGEVTRQQSKENNTKKHLNNGTSNRRG